MNLSKKVIAALVVICMFAAYFIPVKMFKVFAVDGFKITFELGNSNQDEHSITQKDGKHLVIDEEIVDFFDGDDVAVDVDVSATSNNATVTVPAGKSVKFNYNVGRYTVYDTNNHVEYTNTNPAMISSETHFVVEDKKTNINPPVNPNITYNVNFASGSWTVGNVTVTSDKTGAQELSLNDEITLTGFNPDTMVAKVTESPSTDEVPFSVTLTVDGNGKTKLANKTNGEGGLPNNSVFSVEEKTDEQNPGQNYNTQGKIIAKGAAGSYTYTDYNPNTQQDEEMTETYADSYVNAAFSVNGGRVDGGFFPGGEVPATTTYDLDWNQEATDTTVTINFRCAFNYKYVGKVKVNGTEYNVPDFSDRETWLSHHNGQELVFDVVVPKAADDTYNVEVKVERSKMEYMGNFLWTGDFNEQYIKDQNGNPTTELNDDYIGHAKIEFVSVEYTKGNETIKKKFSELQDDGTRNAGDEVYQQYITPDRYVEFGSLIKKDGKTPTFDAGSMTCAEGAKVTLKIVPDYGYQVTAFTINGQDLIIGDNISEFTFVIHGGNAHLGARVTKVENDIKATAAKVDADNSTINLADGVINSGTARLSIEDKELSAEKKALFEEKVAQLGDDYEIASVFDIKLNQVFFKGNAGSDVWNGAELEDLGENNASLGLGVDSSINMEDAVLVHDIHDSGALETIEARGGDTSKNQKLYPVSSFSSYALVVKKTAQSSTTTDEGKEEEKTSSTPTTGDYITASFAVFALAGASLIIVKKLKGASKIQRRYKK